MTTLNGEHVTPERLMSRELSFSCGAVVPAAKRGAVVPTPKWTAGVSEDDIGATHAEPARATRDAERSSPPYRRRRVLTRPRVPATRVAIGPDRRNPTTVELDGPPSWADVLRVRPCSSRLTTRLNPATPCCGRLGGEELAASRASRVLIGQLQVWVQS